MRETPEISPSASSAARQAVHFPPLSPDLTRIAAAWPEMPAPVRQAILALVETSKPGQES